MQYKTTAIILKRSNYLEADRIITILTDNHGKIKARAKGVRKTLSKMAGHLEPFCLSNLILAEGKTFDIICDAKVKKCYFNLRKSLKLTHLANYFSEVIEKMLPEEEEHLEVFQLLEELLDSIDNEYSDLIFPYFELKLLSYIGYEPQIYHCVACKKDLKDENNYFSLVEGGAVCEKCHNHDIVIDNNTIKIMRLILDHRLNYLKKITIDRNLLNEVKNISEKYLKTIHQKEFNSKKFLK